MTSKKLVLENTELLKDIELLFIITATITVHVFVKMEKLMGD